MRDKIQGNISEGGISFWGGLGYNGSNMILVEVYPFGGLNRDKGVPMRIVIVGAGKVGWTLTQNLAAKNDVIVIDQNQNLIDNIINVYDVMGVCGNGASYEIQKEAGADKADLLIATAASDEINIVACLVAKKMGVPHTIARIRNPEYEKQLRFMREDLGLSMVINPEKATAREIARVLRFPTAMKLESFVQV